jgi:hypothetical protein
LHLQCPLDQDRCLSAALPENVSEDGVSPKKIST